MSADNAPVRRQLAQTFLLALRPALEPNASEPALFAAREAAQMLGLSGLDRAIASLHALAGTTVPADVRSIAGRIQRLAAECEISGDTTPFENADREIGELAGEIEAFDWRGGDIDADPDRPVVATLPLDRVFDESVLAGEEAQILAQRLRLEPPVAASLRAALDWLEPGDMVQRTLRLRGEPSLLEVRIDFVRREGIEAARRVLESVGGNLGPAVEENAANAGEWVVRVPSFATRPSYLMVIQGGLRIAIPWHSVLRLRMLPPTELMGSAWRQGHPVLEFIATPSTAAIEFPIVLLAHGLRRGHFVADRLIWRLAAEPCENEWGSPASALSRTVRSEEGEIFWVADPARLLEHLPNPDPSTFVTVTVATKPSSDAADATDDAPAVDVAPPVDVAPAVDVAPDVEERPAVMESPPVEIQAADVAREVIEAIRALVLEPVLDSDSADAGASESSEEAPAFPTLTARDVEPIEFVEWTPPLLDPAVPAVETAPAAPTPADPVFHAEEAAPILEPPPQHVMPVIPAAPPIVAPARRRLALLADDSITARVFLTRMLFQEDIEVEAVASANDLLQRLPNAPWDFVFVDADLPDGHGEPWLSRSLAAATVAAPGARVVALVRDREDLESARAAGIRRTLIKPIDRDELRHVLTVTPEVVE